jgi:hypothetical protein
MPNLVHNEMKRTHSPLLRDVRFHFHRSLVQIWSTVLLIFSVLKLLQVNDQNYFPARRCLTASVALGLLKSCQDRSSNNGVR